MKVETAAVGAGILAVMGVAAVAVGKSAGESLGESLGGGASAAGMNVFETIAGGLKETIREGGSKVVETIIKLPGETVRETITIIGDGAEAVKDGQNAEYVESYGVKHIGKNTTYGDYLSDLGTDRGQDLPILNKRGEWVAGGVVRGLDLFSAGLFSEVAVGWGENYRASMPAEKRRAMDEQFFGVTPATEKPRKTATGGGQNIRLSPSPSGDYGHKNKGSPYEAKIQSAPSGDYNHKNKGSPYETKKKKTVTSKTGFTLSGNVKGRPY